MKRVLLVDGVFHELRVVPSLGIAAIAGYAREQGHDVEMFSPNISYMSEAAAADVILQRRPDVLGVSLLTRHTHDPFVQVLDTLTARGWRGFVCLGGHYASLAHRRLLEEFETVDCVVVGDGEEPFVALLDALSAGQPWTQVPGLAVRADDGGVRLNPPAPGRRLDEYPVMALDFLEELVGRYGREVRVSLVTSRGCYADCSYCSVQAYNRLQNTAPYRMRAVEPIVDEIELVQRRFGVRNIAFEDDNFLVPGPAGIRRARSFRDAITARGLDITLFLQTRPECITHEGISLLRDVGLADIFIGTESFDQATLDLYHRNNTVEESVRALDILESLGFSASVDADRRVRVGSMVFHPYVTLEALLPQAEYFRRYRIPSKKLVKHLFPVEDVELCQRLEREGLLTGDGRYRFVHAEVAAVYDALLSFYERYMSLREDIRRVEKMDRLQRLALDLVEVRAARRVVEDEFLTLFERLCRCGSEGRTVIDREVDAASLRVEQALDMRGVRGTVRQLLEQTRGYAVHY